MGSVRHELTRFFYRRYRAARVFFSTRPPDLFSRLFYWLRHRGEQLLSGRRMSRSSALEARLWKPVYFQRFGIEPLFRVETDTPVAVTSADHVWPRGTAYNSSRNRNFNLKLYHFLHYRPNLRVLDLGCAGGGFVKSLLEDGYSAIGLEGSDWSKKLRSGEWDTCPHHLLTCDITAKFEVQDRLGQPVLFHCITAWEVLEHIPEEKLPILFENVVRHLAADGVFVASVDTAPDADPVAGAVYHVTVKPKLWWLERVAEAGLVECRNHPFTTRDYVRGHGMGLEDWDPADGEGFHLVLQRAQPSPR